MAQDEFQTKMQRRKEKEEVLETMTQLKARAKTWPEPWGSHARGLIRDAHFDLVFCQHRHIGRVVEDLRQALLATEQEMLGEEE